MIFIAVEKYQKRPFLLGYNLQKTRSEFPAYPFLQILQFKRTTQSQINLFDHYIQSLNNPNRVITEMQQKSAKTYLPNNYQQYLLQKKKTMKSVSHQKMNGLPQEHSKQNKPSASLNRTEDEEEDLQAEPNQKDRKKLVIVQKVIHSDFKKMFDEFQNNKFQSIRQKITNQLKKLKESPPIQIPSVSDILNTMEIQSLENINAIRQEYKLPPSKRNIDRLQKMLSFNKFFIILNKEKRWKIFENSTFEEYEAGHRIYSEGDTDDYMYVIIKGCVKQYEQKLTSYNQKIMVNFTSHYEGSNFGEVQGYSQNQKKGKRYHSIQTTQKCYVLKISNAYYRQLISNSAEDDFEKKLNALMESTIFKETSKMMVTPLMSTLEKHILPYGKVLINQGEQVRKLYFVADGNLKVIYIDRARRTIKHLNIEQKPQNFSLNKPKSQQKSRTKSKQYSIHETFYYPETEDTSKSFIYGKKKLIGDEIEYNDQVVFCQLRVGDFFGGKSFLSHVDKEKKEQKSQFFDCNLKAKLSIISSSTQSLVYSIDQKKFFSLSENLQKLIIKGIMDEPYFDEYNIDEKINGQRQWKKYSEKLVENIIKGKKQRNHSFRQ